ncbi:MAG: hypothetical protein ACI4JY_10865 [Oscillospiraceae bacterium]
MKENIIKLVQLGKIPNDNNMSDEVFNEYDTLLQIDEPLTYDEAELCVALFSDDCFDLNWALVHLIETVDYHNVERYKVLISKCNNAEFKEVLETRLKNYFEKHK